ncbi:MAG: 2-amino-4-hydroxy-6-hydroxymethyldihydropteridine diphosphokinase [Gammaproteobacteria bacterium]
MHTLYISVGSNIDPRRHVEQAMAELRQCFDNVQQSSLYESQSVGFDGDNFINLVVKADTDMPIHQVVDSLHAIEAREGAIVPDPEERLPTATERSLTSVPTG